MFERKHPSIDKVMFITEPAVARTPPFKAWVPNYILATFRACSTELLLDSCGVFLEYAKIKQADRVG